MAKQPRMPQVDLLQRVQEAVETGKYRVLPHARIRCSERDVSVPDIETALTTGRHRPKRDRFDAMHDDWSYCFEGPSVDGDLLRVIVVFDGWMLIVTVVALNQGEE